MKIHEHDNVEVRADGHKYALRALSRGENVIKYGFPIGHATEDIPTGAHVHSHNLATNLSGVLEYTYRYRDYGIRSVPSDLTFQGYIRENGDVGIRNDVWIICTVGCVNKIAEAIATRTGAKHFPHPFGCSQLGGDHRTTQLILRGLVHHPNAGGVLVLGLGCENNNIGEFKKVLGETDPRRVRFLNAQDEADEIEAGVKLVKELQDYAATFTRQPIPISKLRVGLKCGGSDGYSGITANPLVGRVCDRLVSHGAACVLTEVPECFGAEHLLFERCKSRKIFDQAVELVNGFKEYFIRHEQPIYENPSPGNRAGGITTLEEKSLGCVQKGGRAPISGVLDYGDHVQESGLFLLNGPGNDIVAVTNLSHAGVHLILFTTGRGTPLGGPVPTIKIATNHALAEKKRGWIDFDASPLADGADGTELTDRLLSRILSIASGEETANERNGCSEISIFKDGVTL